MSHPNERITAALAATEDWRKAYPVIEEAAKALLDAMPASLPRLSTSGLVDALYDPEGPCVDAVRDRIYKALNACSIHGLRDYVVLGAPGRVGSVENARRKLWGPPVKSSTPCCPTCKRPL